MHPHTKPELGDSVVRKRVSITIISNNSSKVPILKTLPARSPASE